MTALHLTRIKELAQTAKGMPGGGGKMSPDLVLALVERLEKAEAMLATTSPSNHQGELSIVMSMRQGDTLFSTGRHVTPQTLRSFASGAINHVSLEAGRVFQDLEQHMAGAMPDDPLDDVLPLASDEKRFTVTGTSPVPDEVALAEAQLRIRDRAIELERENEALRKEVADLKWKFQ